MNDPARPSLANRYLRLGFKAVSVVATVIGLVGVPAQIQQWGQLFALIGSEAGRWVMVVCGVALFLWANGVHTSIVGRLRRRREETVVLEQARAQSEASPAAPYSPVNLLPPQPTAKDEYNSTDDVSPIELQKPWLAMICPRCKGTSLDWGHYQRHCPKCDATGRLPGWILRYLKCVPCRGTGWDFGTTERECDKCFGFGRRLPADRVRNTSATYLLNSDQPPS
jgi:hypothetical protein